VGTAFNTTVTAKDVYGNTVTTDSSTVVTMTSSGATVFDSNGDTVFTDNTKTLSSGAFTISSKDDTAETMTITATSAGGKTGTTGSVTVTALPKYRSKASGNWNAAGTWEVSTDNGSTWGDAVSTPTSAGSTITIRNSHTVTVTAAVTVDEVVVASGGNLTLSAALTVANGTGDDIIVQNGGAMVVSSVPTFNTSATANINGGGILRVSVSGYTGAGTGMNAASYVYQNGAIVEYTLTTAPSSANVVYFPNVDANTIPVLKFTALTASVGAGTPTTINGVTEVGPGVSFSWTGAGTKTFRNGIRGAGDMSQGSAGQFVISGATAELGGAGTLTLGTAGLQINSGCVATLSSDKTIAGIGVLTVVGSLDLNSKTLTMATAPVFSGATLTEIDRNGGSPLVGKIVLSGGTLTYGGTFTVANLGAALQSGDSFTLFTAPAFSGWFGSVSLPALGTSLVWDTNKLATNGVLEIYTFTTNVFQTLSVSSNTAANLLIAKVLSKTTGGRGTTSLTSVGNAAHGSTSISSPNIIYTPTSGYTGSDSFNCVVSDLNGSTTVTVLVTVTDPNDPNQNSNGSNLALHLVDGGGVRLIIAGTAGVTYQVQYTDTLTPPDWQILGNAFVMPSAGLTNIVDTGGGSGRYYRTAITP
jgi:hypothetical protein